MKQRPEFISIGIITKPHGIKGEVLVSPMTDNPHYFLNHKEMYVSDDSGRREHIAIEGIRQKKNAFILKLEGIEDRNQAESFKKKYIDIPFEETEDLENDEYYVFDIIGLSVKTKSGKILGKVKDVLFLSANDVYIIDRDGEELLIPAIKDVIKSIDLEKEVIVIDPIEGLI